MSKNNFVINGKNYINFDAENIEKLVADNVLTSQEAEKILLDNKKNETLKKRCERYKTESDPLYMEWQFDKTEAKEKLWRDKVAEIKNDLTLV